MNLEHWSVESPPLLTIGKAEGDEAYLFTRIVQAATLPGGELLVADRASGDLRIFDSTGRLVRRFGRNGSGPGEFRQLTWAGVDRSGSVTTYDVILRRLSRFSAEGTLEQVVPVPPSPGTPTVGYVVDQFGDRALLMRRVSLPEDPAALTTGLVRDSIELSLMTPDAAQRIPAGRFPGSQSVRAVGRVTAVGPAPFGLRTVIAVADTVFHLSTQEAYEVRAYHPDGRLHRVLRRLVPPQPVSATAKAEWQRQRRERPRSGRPVPDEVTEIAEYRTLPDVFPAHGDIRVDRAGNLWVEDYRPFPDADSITTWIVFSRDGAMVATAELPNTQITEIGTGRVLGVWRDGDGVPSVRVYRLRKPR